MMTTFDNDDTLAWLQQWYAHQTDGDWEHIFGINISTLDNPGWNVEIDLKGTALEGTSLKELSVERTENDWVRCSADGERFKGFCGAGNLSELLSHFRRFAEDFELNEPKHASRDQ